MKKRESKSGVFGIVLIIVIIAAVYFASFPVSLSPEGVTYHGNNITKQYSAGQKISGFVNLSFSDVVSSSMLTSNFEGNISLIELLEANGFSSGDEFNCSSSSCTEGYQATSQINSITPNVSGVVGGFKITGNNIQEISSVNFSLSSTAGASCSPQVFIDPLNDNQSIIVGTKQSGQICSTTYYGCFAESASSSDVIIGQNNEYCENITLPAAPAFRLEANVKNSTSGIRELKMKFKNPDGENLGECKLPLNSQSGTYETLGCNVNYTSITQRNYFVCITAGTGNQNANYKIKFETSTPKCGTGSGDFENLDVDYDLMAKSIQFDQINALELNSAAKNIYNSELKYEFSDYIFENYDGNCEGECIIPITFIGPNNQLISFNNIQLKYLASQGLVETNSFYSVSVQPSEVNSDDLWIDLEKANFTIPLGSTQNKFKLYFNGEEIFQQSITVGQSFAFNVTPSFATIGVTTTFTAGTSANINKSVWDFGDGSQPVTVNGKEATHKYLNEGEFDASVTLTRSDGVTSTKEFTVTVGNAETFSNLTISEYKSRIANLSSQINSFPVWLQEGIKSKISTSALNTSLNTIEQSYNDLGDNESYETIVNDLIELNVPKEIKITTHATSLPLLTSFANADVSHIEDLSGSVVEDQTKLKNQISAWMEENLQSTISYDQISAVSEKGTEVLLTHFTVNVNPQTAQDDYYLIFSYDAMTEGKFKENYGQSVIGQDGNYIPMRYDSQPPIVEFYSVSRFMPEELGIYVSPIISRLGDFEGAPVCQVDNVCDSAAGETSESCPDDCGKTRWGWFSVWIIVLILAAFVVYILLQEWYKRYYERHLFKTENDLYNIINFVYNGRKAGLTDSQIREKLSKASWSGEQITYALRKIDGKRTGMYEIPIFKFRENRKVALEIAKRQKEGVDTRFIKRPKL